MKSLLLLRAVIWDRHETRAEVGSKECLQVLPESLQLPTNSTLWPHGCHLSLDSFHLSVTLSSVCVCVCLTFFEVPKHSFPFSFKCTKKWGEHAKWLTSTHKKVILASTAVTGHKASFLGLVSGMVDFHLGWTEVFKLHTCWCDIFYGFDILHVLIFKKE